MVKSFAISKKLFEKASELIPGGVNSPVRAFRAVSGNPIFFKKAYGSRVVDEDGNEFIDFCMSWGPLILGHSDPDVVEAVKNACGNGLSYGACHKKEIEIAEIILSHFRKFDMVRLTNSGTEAVMTAIRLARGAMKRDFIIKFEGCYHGHSDSMLVKAGSGLQTFGISSSAGVPDEIASKTIVVPLDDEQILEDVSKKMGDKIAAAIIEPLPANNGLLIQRTDFLRFLRELTHKIGALLIFDEVISGFRLGLGGYGEMCGVEADIVTLGKIIGGGMPIGAVVGKKQIMSKLAPSGPVYQAGTLSGNPVAVASGIATLTKLEKISPYEKLDLLGKKFEDKLPDPGMCIRAGSIIWLNLAGGKKPRRVNEINSQSIEKFNDIFHRVIGAGYYIPPSAYEVMFLSTAHTETDVEGFASCLCSILNG